METDGDSAARCPRRRCGNRGRQGARFCIRCGARLEGEDTSVHSPTWATRTHAVLLATAIVVFVGIAIGFGSKNALVESVDYYTIFTYQKQFYRDALLDGRLPLWNPHTFSGWPFAANFLTQTFYPSSLLYLALPQHAAAVVDLVFHLLVAGLGTMWLLRAGFGVSSAGAALSGLAFATCGALSGQILAGHIQFYAAAAYMPIVALCAGRTAEALRGDRHRRRRALLEDGGRDMGVASDWRSNGASRVGYWPWLGGLAVGLQVLSGGIPYLFWSTLFVGMLRWCELLRAGLSRPRAWLSEGASLVWIVGSGVCVGLVQLAPGFELASLCNRGQGSFEYAMKGSFRPELLMKLFWAGCDSGGAEGIWESYAYCGLLPVLGGLAAVAFLGRERRVISLLVCGVVAGTLMMGEHLPVLPLLWKHVPGFQTFRVPARALVLVHFALAILMGIGVSRVTAMWSKRMSVGKAAGIAAFVAALFLHTSDVLYGLRLNRSNLSSPADGFLSDPRQKELLDKLAADRSWHRLWLPGNLWRRNHAYAMNSRSVAGYDNMYLERYGRYVHYMCDTPIDPMRVSLITEETFARAPSPFPFKVLGEKYSGAGRRMTVRDASDPPRRGWFAQRRVVVKDEAEALAYMRGEGFRPYEEVVIEASEGGADEAIGVGASVEGDANVSVEVIERRPEELEIRLGSHPGGVLVLSEIHYPGWVAEAEGRLLPIRRVDSILRGIELPASERPMTISMRFQPATTRIGMVVSLAAWAVCVVAAVGAAYRERKSVTSLPSI